MPGHRYPRKRSHEARDPLTVIGQSYDRLTHTLVVRQVEGAVRYLTKPIDYKNDTGEPDSGREYDRSVTADDANDPNNTATEPKPTDANPLLKASGSDAVVFHSTHDAATQQLDVEVWVRTDLHSTAADKASRRIWVMVQRFPIVEPRKATSRRPPAGTTPRWRWKSPTTACT